MNAELPESESLRSNDAGGQTRSPVRNVEVSADHNGQRIDNFLIAILKTVPRSLVYRILRTGQVRVNKGRIKPSFRLTEGDIVRIPPVSVPEHKAVRVPKSVISAVTDAVLDEDQNWIVINKPVGLAAHAGTGIDFGIVDAVKEIFADPSISLVHRLDRATSGVMVLARNRTAAAHFHQVLIEGRVKKQYAALLCGRFTEPCTVTAKLRKTHPTPNENQVVVDPVEGKSATSHFKCRKSGKRFSLVDVEIETGRTHQIRVHAASIGHPVLGDERYGNEKLNKSLRQMPVQRMFLHARALTFPDLSNGDRRCEYHVPVDAAWHEMLAN